MSKKKLYSLARAALLAAFALLIALGAGPVPEVTYEILDNGYQKLRVNIPGCHTESQHIESVQIDDLIIGVRELSSPGDWISIAPGKTAPQTITLRSRLPHTNFSSGWKRWWQDCSQASASDRKRLCERDISVVFLKRSRAEGRRYDFERVVPVSWQAVEFYPGLPYSVQTLVVQARSGDAALLADAPQLELVPGNASLTGVGNLGISVKIASSGTGSDPDSAWEKFTGGAMVIRGTRRKEVAPFVIKGPLTSGRIALEDWMDNVLSGGPWKRQVVIKETLKNGSTGKTIMFHDAFPVRYVYPAWSTAGKGPLTEEIHIKATRAEVN